MCNFGKSVCTLVLCLHHVIASFLFCISTSASPNTHLETSSPPLAPPRVLQPTCVTEPERAATSSLLTHHIALSRSKEFKTSKTITRLFWALLGRRGWVGHQKQGSCGSRTGNDVLLRNSPPLPQCLQFCQHLVIYCSLILRPCPHGTSSADSQICV